ncbi:class I SAM-dependent methyltransferase [Allosphingosinicella sp.]|jgi:ubiquinone/menaquinone biosynthesis C-methylase UbiE|uniref:class I SAM-dependent methyltransferase n=1 Tax=Allosphingosinicella sp. TaxID=2823234 RepID=UPI002EE555B5
MTSDSAFLGSIPVVYHRCLGPLLFEPFAEDLAERVAALAPRNVLETAAGTGIVTAAMVRSAPEAVILATDLNQAMLDVAAERIRSPLVRFEQADAQALPFEDGRFDTVVCQFGAMFFPDRIGAYREARRVLKKGGRFLFNVWDRLETNPVSEAVAGAVAAQFPGDPPSFLSRVPFGYHDQARIEAELYRAGFDDVVVETVAKTSLVASPRDAAVGLCQGSPLRAEIEARGDLEEATEAAAEALQRMAGPRGLESAMSAHVVSALV